MTQTKDKPDTGDTKADAKETKAKAKSAPTLADLVVVKRQLETLLEERQSSFPTVGAVMHTPGGGVRPADWRQQDHAKETAELALPLLERATAACDAVAPKAGASSLMPDASGLPTTTGGWIDLITAILGIVKGILGGAGGTVPTGG